MKERVVQLVDTPVETDLASNLKAAMRRMPSAVSVITTRHPESGEPAGMIASAVVPVSMEPPSMLVSINRNSSIHPVIALAEGFCVNILKAPQHSLVATFSSGSLRSRRFAGEGWDDLHGLPSLRSAVASIRCRVRHRTEFGTHEIFIGEVIAIALDGEAEPLAWIEGSPARIEAFRTALGGSEPIPQS